MRQHTSRVRGTAQLAALAAVAAVGGCKQSDWREGRLIVCWADVSASVADRRGLVDAWKAINDESTLRDGDRIVLARISGATYDEFRPVVDVRLPTKDPINGVVIEERRARREARDSLSVAMDRTMEGSPSSRTSILAALRLTERLVRADGRPGAVLVIMSDMIEESADLNLMRAPKSQASINLLLTRLRAADEIPDLRGISVIVVDLPSRAQIDKRAVERFWRAYFLATGATLELTSYAPTILRRS